MERFTPNFSRFSRANVKTCLLSGRLGIQNQIQTSTGFS